MARALTIDITTRDAQTLAALKRVQKELRDTGGEAGRTSKSGSTLRDVLGGIAVGAGLRKSIGEFEEAEVSARATEAAIRSTGNAAQVSAEDQDELVASLSRLAGIDDEVVNGGANMLRTFTQIKGAKFGEALGASLDYAAFKGKDLASSAEMVGKALNDPFTGYLRLKRAGVEFDATQVSQIKNFEAVNDVAGAQGVILAELEKEYGGQAEAAATSSGRMKVAFDDAAESLGGALAPGLTLAADAGGAASDVFQHMPQPLQLTASAGLVVALVGPKIAEGWNAAATSARGAQAAMTSSVSGFGYVKSGALGAAAGLAAYNAAYDALEAKYRSGIDTSALLDDLTLFGQGMSDGERILEQFGGSYEEMAGKVTALADAFDNSGWENLTKGSNTAYGNVHKLKNEFADLDEALATLARSDPSAASEVYRQFAGNLTAAGASAEDIATVLPKYNDQVERAAEANSKGAGAVEKHAQEQKDLGDEVETTAEKMARQVDEATALYNLWDQADQAGRDVAASVVAVADAQDQVEVAERGVADAKRAEADSHQAVADARRGVATAEQAVEQARRGVEAATRGLTSAEKEAAQAAADVVTRTEELAQARREAAGDSDAMRDALEGVTDAEEAVARSQEDSLTAQQALDTARAGYAQTLRGLARDAAGAVDDVLSAEIRLRDAQRRAAELGQPDRNGEVKPVTDDERLAAAIAIREAERALERAREIEAEARAEYQRQQAAGVEGSDAVVAARDAVAAAADREAQAQRDLEGAVANVAATQETANERVADAQDALADAIDRRAQADQRVVDARESVVDAHRRVGEAVYGVEEANRRVSSAIDGTRDAHQRVIDAKDAVVEARRAVRDAEEQVTEKLRDQAVKQYEVDLKTRGAAAASKTFRERIEEIGRTLDPNGAPARNLAAYAWLLGFITDPSRAAAVASLGPSAPPGAVNAERQGRSAQKELVPAGASERRVTAELHVHGVTDPMAVAEMALHRADYMLRDRGRSR